MNFSLDELDSWSSWSNLKDLFHGLHQMSFGYSERSSATEIVNVRLVGIGVLPRPQFSPLTRDNADPSAAVKGSRKVYFQGEWHRVKIYERARIKCGNNIPGPAIVEQADSTTFFYPEQTAELDAYGNLLIHVAAK